MEIEFSRSGSAEKFWIAYAGLLIFESRRVADFDIGSDVLGDEFAGRAAPAQPPRADFVIVYVGDATWRG